MGNMIPIYVDENTIKEAYKLAKSGLSSAIEFAKDKIDKSSFSWDNQLKEFKLCYKPNNEKEWHFTWNKSGIGVTTN